MFFNKRASFVQNAELKASNAELRSVVEDQKHDEDVLSNRVKIANNELHYLTEKFKLEIQGLSQRVLSINFLNLKFRPLKLLFSFMMSNQL